MSMRETMIHFGPHPPLVHVVHPGPHPRGPRSDLRKRHLGPLVHGISWSKIHDHAPDLRRCAWSTWSPLTGVCAPGPRTAHAHPLGARPADQEH